MEFSKPVTWILFLIVGVGIWTDLHHLTGDSWDGTNWLYTASCLLLVTALLTFLFDRMTLTKWTLIGGMGLAVLGTIIS